MKKDYYSGKGSEKKANKKTQKNPHKILKIAMALMLATALVLMIVFLVQNLNKRTEFEKLDKNNYIDYILVEDGSLDVEFDKEKVRYVITTSKDKVGLQCELESDKSKIENCIDIDVPGESAKHQIKVTAENGNVKNYYFTVVKLIDKPVRITDVVGMPEEWVTKDFVFTIKASADDGLHNQAYSYDGGETWTSSPSYNIDQNQTLKVVVRDVNGVLSESREIYIHKVDKTIPMVSLNEVQTSASKTTLITTVTPSTTASGYIYTWYKDGEKITGSSASLEVRRSGKYHVEVKTGAGIAIVSNTVEVSIK